ncbi:MAG: hypothetical protein RLZZ490_1474 [Cyanobacteriota bacterium]
MTSTAERQFEHLWESSYPDLDLVAEYQGIKGRKFRFDFAHVPSKTAIEIQGGIYLRHGGHNSAAGLHRDYEKLNLAQWQGWTVFQLSPDMVEDFWIDLIADFIRGKNDFN